MLFRRVAKHVRDQNWTAVALDFIIVVAGVFIGIQLGNWNEAQQDRREERSALVRMHEEVIALTSEFSEVADEEARVRSALYDARSVLLGLTKRRPLTPWECQAISRSDAPLLPEVSVAIVDELVSSGRLDLLTDPGIRSQVSSVHQLRSKSDTRFNTYLRGGLSLIRAYPELVPFGLSPADDPEDEDGWSPSFECNTDAMMANSAFLNDMAQNVSIYATAGNVIRDQEAVISDLHEAIDRGLGIDHEHETE